MTLSTNFCQLLWTKRLRNNPNITLSARLGSTFAHLRFGKSRFVLLFFFFLGSSRTIWPSQPWTVHGCTVHRSHKFHFSVTFSLKIGPTVLFTYLKIISLQCFQFQFSILAKINSIQDPKNTYQLIHANDHMTVSWFFIFTRANKS